MIFEIISRISSILSENLKIRFKLDRDIVKIQPIGDKPEDGIVHLFLTNIERETTGGITFNRKKISSDHSSKGNPDWYINFYLVIAVVFPQKQYADSLKIVTEVLKTIQANYVLVFDQLGIHFCIEPVNLSFQELSNLWSITGGSYYPSVICKIRSLPIDSETIVQIDTAIKEKILEI